MGEMAEAEWRRFLTTPVRPGMLGTVRADGRPHMAPVWYDLDDDGTVLFTTGAGTVKGTAVRRDQRVCLCVDDDQPPFAYVLVEGLAEVTEDPAALLQWATRIGGRYMGAQRAGEYGRRNGVPGELLVRVVPTKVVARTFVAD